MHFTNDINLGNVVTLVTFIITLYQFHQSNVRRLHRIEFKVALMWKHFAHKFDLPEELGDSEKDSEKE